jgi:hypothetical protein
MFTMEAKSANNNPNYYDDEDDDIESWWDSGLNSSEIEMKLNIKRKNFFSWN